MKCKGGGWVPSRRDGAVDCQFCNGTGEVEDSPPAKERTMSDPSAIDMVEGELAGINARYAEELIPVRQTNPVSELQMRLTAMQMDASAAWNNAWLVTAEQQAQANERIAAALESIAASLRGSVK